jgi:hypothetical protein
MTAACLHTVVAVKGINMKLFTREELIELRDIAQGLVNTPGLNTSWATAYTAMVIAADYLDAIIARAEISQGDEVPNGSTWDKIPEVCWPDNADNQIEKEID